MQAFQFVAAQKPAELREVQVPEPGPGQVLLKVGGAGACHSDLHILEAAPKPGPARAPFILGHENAGWVERLGSGATGFAKGDPVIVYGPWGCGLCMNCRLGGRTTARTPGTLKQAV
jgi:propanol-preferring alcohol dehydrogenase